MSNKTPAGLDIVQTVFAPHRNRWFVIARKPIIDDRMPEYVVETINKTGKHSKRQVRQLWDGTYDTEDDAKRAIDRWDVGAKKNVEYVVGAQVRINPLGRYPGQGGGGAGRILEVNHTLLDGHPIRVEWDCDDFNVYGEEDLILV